MSDAVYYSSFQKHLFPESAYLVKNEMQQAADLAESGRCCDAYFCASLHVIKAVAFSFFNSIKYSYEAVTECIGFVIVLNIKEGVIALYSHSLDAAKSLFFTIMGVGILAVSIFVPRKVIPAVRPFQEKQISDYQEELEECEDTIEALQDELKNKIEELEFVTAGADQQNTLNKEQIQKFKTASERLSKQLEQRNSKLQNVDKQREATQKELESSLSRIADLERQIKSQREAFQSQEEEFGIQIDEKNKVIDRHEKRFNLVKKALDESDNNWNQKLEKVQTESTATIQKLKKKFKEHWSKVNKENAGLQSQVNVHEQSYNSLQTLHEQCLRERTRERQEIATHLSKLEAFLDGKQTISRMGILTVQKGIALAVNYFKVKDKQDFGTKLVEMDAFLEGKETLEVDKFKELQLVISSASNHFKKTNGQASSPQISRSVSPSPVRSRSPSPTRSVSPGPDRSISPGPNRNISSKLTTSTTTLKKQIKIYEKKVSPEDLKALIDFLKELEKFIYLQAYFESKIAEDSLVKTMIWDLLETTQFPEDATISTCVGSLKAATINNTGYHVKIKAGFKESAEAEEESAIQEGKLFDGEFKGADDLFALLKSS